MLLGAPAGSTVDILIIGPDDDVIYRNRTRVPRDYTRYFASPARSALMVADHPARISSISSSGMSLAIEALLGDPGLRAAIGGAARRRMQREHTWARGSPPLYHRVLLALPSAWYAPARCCERRSSSCCSPIFPAP